MPSANQHISSTDSTTTLLLDNYSADSLVIDSLTVDSLAVDSLAVDSLAVDSLAVDSLIQIAQTAATDPATTIALPAWHDGLEPTMRQVQPGNHSGFLTIIALMFVVMIFNFKHMKRLIKTYVEELWKVRSGRDNVFDERPAGDTRILLLLMLQSIVCIGILLASAICLKTQPADTPLTGSCVAAVTAVVAAGYLFRFTGYHLVGYAFGTPETHHDWVRAYNASIALLGVALIVPAMLAIFYPQVSSTVVIAAIVLYLCTKITFILKGFRIFYTNFTSIIYFILYLCTLEITPLLFVYKCSVQLAEQTL